MNKRLPLLPPPAACLSGKTWGPVDDTRIERLAARVSDELGGFFTESLMTLVSFRPPYENPADAPDAYFEVWFQGDRGLRALLSVAVTRNKDALAYDLEGWGLEAARNAASGEDQHDHTVCLTNFDEAWRFVCLCGERLRVAQVRLSAGG